MKTCQLYENSQKSRICANLKKIPKIMKLKKIHDFFFFFMKLAKFHYLKKKIMKFCQLHKKKEKNHEIFLILLRKIKIMTFLNFLKNWHTS